MKPKVVFLLVALVGVLGLFWWMGGPSGSSEAATTTIALGVDPDREIKQERFREGFSYGLDLAKEMKAKGLRAPIPEVMEPLAVLHAQKQRIIGHAGSWKVAFKAGYLRGIR